MVQSSWISIAPAAAPSVAERTADPDLLSYHFSTPFFVILLRSLVIVAAFQISISYDSTFVDITRFVFATSGSGECIRPSLRIKLDGKGTR